MTGFVLSPRAQKDLGEIWDYTVETWGARQAELYIRQIEAAIKAVAADPGCGKSCDAIRMGYRKYPAGSHVVFYRRVENGVDVVRILHARMDFERHL